ncbi:TPM domain-containing protein [Arachidicoccus sp.]|uniref:TPM domain-containing protein n=1 Tax=Arachidicoccus sp. TaxID=1872624 RepID=UPI003D1FF836
MFNIFKKKVPQFFSVEEQEEIVHAIQQAEVSTSGEVRLYVESKCSYVNALDRAIEIFAKLKMYQTTQRNGVLVYVALKDKQLAIFADEAIYQKAGSQFWNEKVQQMISHFNKNNYAKGLIEVILEIGQSLAKAFPYDATTDKNELPDDIVFGK